MYLQTTHALNKLFCMLYWTILLCMMHFNTLESSDLLYRPQPIMFNFTYYASEQAQKVS